MQSEQSRFSILSRPMHVIPVTDPYQLCQAGEMTRQNEGEVERREKGLERGPSRHHWLQRARQRRPALTGGPT